MYLYGINDFIFIFATMLQLQIKKIIKECGLTVTKMRKKVLSVFLNSAKPLSLDDIQSLVGYIDRVTLFRILSIFEEKKIIHVIRLDRGGKLFALCESCNKDNHNHNHIHFQCEECDDVSCLPIQHFPQFTIPKYRISNVNISMNGLCVKCNN